jgi:putative ABC transport system substrate-binding protein
LWLQANFLTLEESMRRRDFLGFVGGAAVWPRTALAQQSALPAVGYFRSTSASGFEHLIAAFRQGLRVSGFVEGQNVAVEHRYADNQPDRLPALAADLIRRPVAVIVGNTPAALAAKVATTTVPIVFATGSDPVRDGLVTSLNRPSANVTGVVFFSGLLGAKRLELLRQVAPKANTIAMLINSVTREAEEERRDAQIAAQAIGLQIVALDATTERDIAPAFATFAERKCGALIVGSGALLNSNRDLIVALAARHALPASYSLREFAVAGGLMSYGASQPDAYQQAGIYAGRILKGEKPADLPVMRSTKFEFVLNLKSAKELGLELPPTLLALADEVIE